MENRALVGFYNKSVIITYISLASAFVSMYMSMHGQPKHAIFFLLFSGLCDMFDGPVARRMKRTEQEKSFGMNIDSLCDLVCFGVTPGVLCIYYFVGEPFDFLGYAGALALTLCGVIRLAYFNVTEEIRSKETTGRRTTYQGLPITCSCMTAAIAYVLAELMPEFAKPYVFLAGMLVTSLLFVLNFPVPKTHGKGMLVMIAGALLLFTAVMLV